MSPNYVKQKKTNFPINKPFFQKFLTRVDLDSIAVLMVIAILVGFVTGLIAVIFIKAIAWVTRFSFEQGLPSFLSPLGSFWILGVLLIGGLISGPIIAYWAPEAKGHGVPEVLQSIIMKGGRIRPRVAAVKSLASTICIGTGGSAGREGPIVQVGAALGSTSAQIMRLSTEQSITLVACGAAAGIAATFNAPIAGVVFAMEVILGEFTTHYFGTVVVSAVTASIVSRHFLGSNPAFNVPAYALVSAWELIFYALLGLLAASTAWIFVGVLYFFEDRFDLWKIPDFLKPAIGAIPVGFIGIIYPQALGTGLSVIGDALLGNLPRVLLLMLIFAKVLATSFTLGSGNSGGIFSPALFIGAMLGGVFGSGIHTLFPTITANTGAYALVGMASVFAAAAHAPLTAFLIVFEMSGDYRMILPLMITVGLSTLISQRLRRDSIYSIKLRNRGIPIERDRDVDIMQGLRVEEVMTRDPDVIYADQKLAELADAFIQTRHHGFPVLDRDNRFVGVVTYEDLKRVSVEGSFREIKVADIIPKEIVTVFPEDPVSKALLLMSNREVGRVPVLDSRNPTKLIGLIRRQDIVRAYRYALLNKLQSKHHRESVGLSMLTSTEMVRMLLGEGMAAAGKRIRELDLPHQVLIISVQREGNILIAHGETRLKAGDTIIALAERNVVDEFKLGLIQGMTRTSN